jgi:hypothetical protein
MRFPDQNVVHVSHFPICVTCHTKLTILGETDIIYFMKLYQQLTCNLIW